MRCCSHRLVRSWRFWFCHLRREHGHLPAWRLAVEALLFTRGFRLFTGRVPGLSVRHWLRQVRREMRNPVCRTHRSGAA